MKQKQQQPDPETVLRGHAADVTSVRFMSESDDTGYPLLLSGSSDGEIRLWSLRTRRPIATTTAHRGASVLTVRALAGGLALSQGRDGYVRVWDARDGLRAPLVELPAACYNFCQCACSTRLSHERLLLHPHGNGAGEAAANGQSGSAIGDRPLAGDVASVDNRPVASAPAVLANSDTTSLIAMATEDAQNLHLWDLRQRREACVLKPSESLGRAGMCMCVRFVTESTVLAGWEDGSLQLFDLRTAALPSQRRLHSEPLLCVDVDARGKHALTGAADCKLCVVPIEHGDTGPPDAELSIPITDEASGSGGIASVCFRPDGKIFAAGGWDRRVRLWQWRNFKPLAVLRHHTATVNAVEFSRCSHWLASASSDRTIALWKLFPPKDCD